MEHVQVRLGFPKEEIDRIFNGAEPNQLKITTSFHSSLVTEHANRRTSSEIPYSPPEYKERGTIIGQRVDPNIPCKPGSGFVPAVLPVQTKVSMKRHSTMTNKPKNETGSAPMSRDGQDTQKKSNKTSFVSRERKSVPRLSAKRSRKFVQEKIPPTKISQPEIHTHRIPIQEANDIHQPFHIHTTFHVRTEPQQIVQTEKIDVEKRQTGSRLERKRWVDAVQWLKEQREMMHPNEKLHSEIEAKRQRLIEMDRQIRHQNQTRFVKSHTNSTSPRQAPKPTRIEFELPPRKPPVPRLSRRNTSKTRRKRNDNQEVAQREDDQRQKAPPRPRRRIKPKEIPPEPELHPEEDTEDTKKRREQARVYMEEQKRKRQLRARREKIHLEEELADRRAQLEKLDAVRLQRVQQSVAFAKKHPRQDSIDEKDETGEMSISELLLGFQLPPSHAERAVGNRIPGPPLRNSEIIQNDDVELTDSAPETIHEIHEVESEESSGNETDEVCAEETSVIENKNDTELLRKLQTLKNLTDSLSSRVTQLSNNIDDDSSDSSDHHNRPGQILPRSFPSNNVNNTIQDSRRSEGQLDSHDSSPQFSLQGPEVRPPSIAHLHHDSDCSSTSLTPSRGSIRHFEHHDETRDFVSNWSRVEHDDEESMTPSVKRNSLLDEGVTGTPAVHISQMVDHEEEEISVQGSDSSGNGSDFAQHEFQGSKNSIKPSEAARRIEIEASQSNEDVGENWRRPRSHFIQEAISTRLKYSSQREAEDYAVPSDNYAPSSSRHIGMYRERLNIYAERDAIAQRELDRMVEETRDSHSLVDMYAMELYKTQQLKRESRQVYDHKSPIIDLSDGNAVGIPSPNNINAKRWDEEPWTERIITTQLKMDNEGDETTDKYDTYEAESVEEVHGVDGNSSLQHEEDIETSECAPKHERSIDELLAEAHRVLQSDKSSDNFWDRAIRDELESDEIFVAPAYSNRKQPPRVVVEDETSDRYLRYSPRTLSRQMMAAVDFQESLHEAHINLSALEFAHELERHQEEALAWGQEIQEDVDSMAQAQLLLDKHIQMQEELHQQELVLQAMEHAAEEREKLVEQSCQTEEMQRHHAGTMAQWMVDAGTTAIESRDNVVQCTLKHSVGVQNDDYYDADQVQTRKEGTATDANLKDEPLALKLEITEKSNSNENYSEIFENSVKEPQRLSRDETSAYSEGFESPVKEDTYNAVSVEMIDDVQSQEKASLQEGSDIDDAVEDEMANATDAVSNTAKEMEDDTVARIQNTGSEEVEYSQGFESPPKPGQDLIDDSKVYSEEFESPVKPEPIGDDSEVEDDTNERSHKSDIQSEVSKDDVEDLVQEDSLEEVEYASIEITEDSPALEKNDEALIPSIDNDDAYSEEFESPRKVTSSKYSDVDDMEEVEIEDDPIPTSLPLEQQYQVSGVGLVLPAVANQPTSSHYMTATAESIESQSNIVETYLQELHVKDPEKEEYIRSILLRKASEDRILDMRLKSLQKRTNLSRMQYQAERIHLDGSRAANVAKCYEDMVLFRSGEPEDPKEVEILAIAFNQVVVVQPASSLIQKSLEVPKKDSAVVLPQPSEALKDSGSEYSFEEAETNASVEDAVVSGIEEKESFEEVLEVDGSMIEEMPTEKSAENDVIEDDNYSMDDFASKDEIGTDVVNELKEIDDVNEIDEDKYSSEEFASAVEDARMSIVSEKELDELESPASTVNNELEIADDVNENIDDIEPEEMVKLDEVVDNSGKILESAPDYSMDDFVSGSIQAVGEDKIEDALESSKIGEYSVDFEDAESAIKEEAVEDAEEVEMEESAVEDETKVESGIEDGIVDEDESDNELVPDTATKVLDEEDDGYSNEDFEGSVQEMQEDKEESMEHDILTAEKESNTSQELQSALHKIEAEYLNHEVVYDEAKWTRRKAQAIALVEAKERAIKQRQREENVKQIQALVSYSLGLNVEGEVEKVVASNAIKIPKHDTKEEKVEVVEEKKTKDGSFEEYSDSFEDKQSGGGYDDDDFEADAEEIAQETEVVQVIEEQITKMEFQPDPTDATPLSKSMEERESHVEELKEKLMVSQTEALRMKKEVENEERRQLLEKEAIDLAHEIDQTDRLFASEASRLESLKENRHAVEANVLVQDPASLLNADDESFEGDDEDDGNSAEEEREFEASGGIIGAKEVPTESIEEYEPEEDTNPLENDLGVSKSLELSVIDGDSMSEEEHELADMSFDSYHAIAPSISLELSDEMDKTPLLVVSKPVNPPLQVIPDVLDDSFTSVDGIPDVIDLLEGYDVIEDAIPPNYTHDIGIQTKDSIFNALDGFDYVENALPPSKISLMKDLLASYDEIFLAEPAHQLVSFPTDHEEKDEIELQNLLDDNHIDNSYPQEKSDDALDSDLVVSKRTSMDLGNLLADFDYIEPAIEPFRHDLHNVHDVVHASCNASLSTPSHNKICPKEDNLWAYDYVEAVIPVALHTADLQLTETMSDVHVSLDIGYDHIENALPVVPKEIDVEENSSLRNLLLGYDHVEAVERPDNEVDIIDPPHHDEIDVWNEASTLNEPAVDDGINQIDRVTSLLWDDLLNEAITSVQMEPHEDLAASIEFELCKAEAEEGENGRDKSRMVRMERTADRLTDSLLVELLQDSLTTVIGKQRKLPDADITPPVTSRPGTPIPAEFATSSRPGTPIPSPLGTPIPPPLGTYKLNLVPLCPATAPPGATPLQNVTEFPQQYTTLVEARRSHDWSEWDREQTSTAANGERPRTPFTSASAAHARMRLLRDMRLKRIPIRPASNAMDASSHPRSVKEILQAKNISGAETVANAASRFVKEIASVDTSLVDSIMRDLLDDTVSSLMQVEESIK